MVQRCLVHIQRMCLLWLTRFPKHLAGVELRALVLMLLKIKVFNDRLWWINELSSWYNRHKDYLDEKTYNEDTGRYWYKHKLLRRSYFTIKRALPNMFHYLKNHKIPATTNGIEGYFGHLKNHLDLHRGLSAKHRINFIKWYIYLSNRKWVFWDMKLTKKSKGWTTKLSNPFFRISINPISGRLLSSRAYILFRLIAAYYKLKMKKTPTIFGYITFLNHKATR